MPTLATRNDFAEYCLRRLGKPAININVAPSQTDDRIDDAYKWLVDYHFDFTRKVYFKYQVTDTDITNRYITLPDYVHSVSVVMSASALGSLSQYNQQFFLNLTDAARIDLQGYYMSMQHINFIDALITPVPRFEYQKYDDKLIFDASTLGMRIKSGQWLVIEMYVVLDPEQYPQMWNNRTFQDLATAYIKKQWGQNMLKFGGIQLPGGITLNGKEIYEEAESEIAVLKDKFKMEYQDPDLMQIG